MLDVEFDGCIKTSTVHTGLATTDNPSESHLSLYPFLIPTFYDGDGKRRRCPLVVGSMTNTATECATADLTFEEALLFSLYADDEEVWDLLDAEAGMTKQSDQ